MESEGIKILFDDGTEYNLPDISYEKFTEHMFKSGSSDIEYDKYCRDNNMKDLSDFNGQLNLGVYTIQIMIQINKKQF